MTTAQQGKEYPMLSQKYSAALASARSTSSNPHLVHLSNAVEQVELASKSNPSLKYFVDTLLDLLDKPNFALTPKLTNEFAQTLGEAHFWTMCKEKGVVLNRIPEQSHKTPDFETVGPSPKIHFEVKTLSIVGGEHGVADTLTSGVDANIHLEEQLRQGKRIAIAEHEVKPYGDKPYKEGGPLRAVINTLIEKARQNIKADQFANPNTFLVLNLSLIPPYRTEPKVLRPSYPDDLMYPKAVTGELWTVAFGIPGMLIQNSPEHEGKPAIEGILDKLGILHDPEFAFISGIIFMIHPWQGPSQLLGLARNGDLVRWMDEANLTHGNHAPVWSTFHALVGRDWNDSDDTNGWSIAANA
jgi:hypothetical protein